MRLLYNGSPKNEVKASSLIELIVAMVLISVSFILFLIFFVKINTNILFSSSTEAYQLATSVLNRAVAERDVRNEQYVIDDFKVVKEVTPFLQSKKLMQIKIMVTRSKRSQVVEVNRLLYVY